MNTLEFRPPRSHGLWVVTVVTVAIALAMAVSVALGLPTSADREPFPGTALIWSGWIVAGTFVYFTLRTLRSYTRLTPEGITDRTVWEVRFIPWSEVTDISIELAFLRRRSQVFVRCRHEPDLRVSAIFAISPDTREEEIIAYWHEVQAGLESARTAS
ncbi:hypothetical protein [Embleya hyalina]|uniref:Uncharacterized protein n=1 Tax=Embleya hyalina TaxID=516124 RepID=A0A401YWV4_9ACTN|nr:hypothetical protein [Embleya hyalina]GCD99094.1 hypothetical protein EHYA_06806 [Embleya hyalina]